MAIIVYALCSVTSMVCFVLLLRGYKRNKARLLLCSSLCFFFVAIQNIILFVDLVLVPNINLLTWRTVTGFIGPVILLFALIWDKK